MQNNCGIIILAAGSSSRLGTAKQMLRFGQTTLLENSITVALEAMADRVIVVLGDHANNMEPAIKNERLSVIINEEWQEGMAASIRCGLNYLVATFPDTGSAIFMVCDQPYVNADLLNQLVILQKQTGDASVASKYADTIGIPAIFNKSMFAELLQLKGDNGAKKLIMQQDNIACVPFPLGNIDIDTAADYEAVSARATVKTEATNPG